MKIDTPILGLIVIVMAGLGSLLAMFAPGFEDRAFGLFLGWVGFWLLGRYVR